jgi:hypothetical protein
VRTEYRLNILFHSNGQSTRIPAWGGRGTGLSCFPFLGSDLEAEAEKTSGGAAAAKFDVRRHDPLAPQVRAAAAAVCPAAAVVVLDFGDNHVVCKG